MISTFVVPLLLDFTFIFEPVADLMGIAPPPMDELDDALLDLAELERPPPLPPKKFGDQHD